MMIERIDVNTPINIINPEKTGDFDEFVENEGGIVAMRDFFKKSLERMTGFPEALDKLLEVVDADDHLDEEERLESSTAFQNVFSFSIGILRAHESRLGEGIDAANFRLVLEGVGYKCDELLSGNYGSTEPDVPTPADRLHILAQWGFEQTPGFENYIDRNLNHIHDKLKYHHHARLGAGVAANVMISLKNLEISREFEEIFPHDDEAWDKSYRLYITEATDEV